MLMADAATGALLDGAPRQRAFREVRMIRSRVAMNLANAGENYGRTDLGFDSIPPLFQRFRHHQTWRLHYDRTNRYAQA